MLPHEILFAARDVPLALVEKAVRQMQPIIQRFEDIDARLERISFNLEQYVKMQDKIVENAHKQEKQLKFMVEERQLILQMLKPMIQLCVEIGSKDTSTAALDAQEALHTYYTKRAQEFV